MGTNYLPPIYLTAILSIHPTIPVQPSEVPQKVRIPNRFRVRMIVLILMLLRMTRCMERCPPFTGFLLMGLIQPNIRTWSLNKCNSVLAGARDFLFVCLFVYYPTVNPTVHFDTPTNPKGTELVLTTERGRFKIHNKILKKKGVGKVQIS